MKQLILAVAAVVGMAGHATTAPIVIDRVDPPCWYVGMKNPSLQLMVHGTDIAQAQVSIERCPGAVIDSVVRLDSPNYLLVYVNTAGIEAGTLDLKFTRGKKSHTVPYEMRSRDMAGDARKGFSNADVLYLLMPDRFADGDPSNNTIEGMNAYTVNRNEPSLRHGGDLAGIEQHLDYFTDLGVTALWFTPILENNSPDSEGRYSTYHGYASTDFYRVDPRFGSNDDYRRMVDNAHKHGLKVVMDMIFNHCSDYHMWLQDVPSHDWFNSPDYKNNYLQTNYNLTTTLDPYASEVDLRETVEGWFVRSMPDINQHNPHAMTYLKQSSMWWVEFAGIDGIRMDTYPYAYADAMAAWMKEINEEYPNFNVVGESWVESPYFTAAMQQDSPLSPTNTNLKTVMDFALRTSLDSAAHENTTDGRGFYRVYSCLAQDMLYTRPDGVMAFLENHDTDRYLKNGNDTRPLKQALALLLTLNRTPQLYYGTEVLMNGTKRRSDGYVRKDFVGGFPGDKRTAFTPQGRTDQENEMYNWLKTVLHWRQGNDVITRGSLTQFIPRDGIYLIARRLDHRTVLTIVNGTKHNATMHVARYAEVIKDATTALDIPTGATIDLTHDITLPARGTLILQY